MEGEDGRWHLTLYIENGRVADTPEQALMTGLRQIALVHRGDFRMTPNQNLILAGVPEDRKPQIEELARKQRLMAEGRSALRLRSIACVAVPTCPQAMAEAERYFPDLAQKVEILTLKHGLADLDLVLRVTGCPNGCARPYLAEIGLVGKGPGKYSLLLGGDGKGARLNKLFRENIGEQGILAELDGLFARFAAGREPGERFGDFVIRADIVRRVRDAARDFHD